MCTARTRAAHLQGAGRLSAAQLYRVVLIVHLLPKQVPSLAGLCGKIAPFVALRPALGRACIAAVVFV